MEARLTFPTHCIKLAGMHAVPGNGSLEDLSLLGC